MASITSPHGETYTVPDEAVSSLRAQGWRAPGTGERPSAEWSIKRLREYAAAHEVDLGKARLKADVLAAISQAG
jgi:hypothetical protein